MRTLSKKEIQLLNSRIGIDYFSKKDVVQEEGGAYFTDKKLRFFTVDASVNGLVDNRVIPSLRVLLEQEYLPKVVIDMGAIPFVIKGADVMRPGIRSSDEGLTAGAIVAIVDETHDKPIAVGKLLFSSDELMSKSSGKVIKTLHVVGDKWWKRG